MFGLLYGYFPWWLSERLAVWLAASFGAARSTNATKNRWTWRFIRWDMEPIGPPTSDFANACRYEAAKNHKFGSATMTVVTAPEAATAAPHDPYQLRISRLTVDKLGVKLYDKASAVVAELVANAYDADAEHVSIELPLGTELCTRDEHGELLDHGYTIVVSDDGIGMTPQQAQDFYLNVGRNRRDHPEQGAVSPEKGRRVMGRKGIGKLAPFGICRRIEILSSGGTHTADGYITTHFFLDFDQIVADEDTPVILEAGALDATFRLNRGTTVILSHFLPKRVPDERTFHRQLARRFRLAGNDFEILIRDARDRGGAPAPPVVLAPFDVPAVEGTIVDLAARPVNGPNGQLQVRGWLGMATEAYRDEEMAGVRLYARDKIVATTRDFELPAGYTGEFTMRSYLVGEVHAEWLDEEEDLIRTDRQSILWDSELGQALREWGAALIREIGERSRQPRRERVRDLFLARSGIHARASARYADVAVVDAAVDLAKRIGSFADEGELADTDYVSGLTDLILTLAPHQALVEAFREIADQKDASVDDLIGLFGKARVAELASYSQIAAERVLSITELESALHTAETDEAALQQLIARAPWLIRPDWSVITENQALKTFRDEFTRFWKERFNEDIVIAIAHETKRPDFTLVHLGRMLHVVELKVPGGDFGNDDYKRLENYLVAFEDFFARHHELANAFPGSWQIDLICDGVNITDTTARRAFEAEVGRKRVVRATWVDFLANAKTAHEQFLNAHERARDAQSD